MNHSDNRRMHFEASTQSRALAVGIPAALAGLAILAVVYVSPTLARTPGLDSGGFLYVGSRILHGAVPYRDVWASNPPLMYYLNALGLALGGSSRCGVWLLEAASVSAAVLLLYALLRGIFGVFPAVVAALALTGNLIFVLGSGNLPETYGLLVQVGLLVTTAKALSNPVPRWPFLITGALIGLSISLRLTFLGLPAVVILSLLVVFVWNRDRRGWISLLWIGLGFGLICLLWAAVFGLQNALPALWDQAVRYPLMYSGVTNPQRIGVLGEVLKALYAQSGFFVLALLSWFVVFPYLFANDHRFRQGTMARPLGWLFLAAGVLIVANSLLDDRTGGLVVLSALSRYRLVMLAVGLVISASSVLFFTGWLAKVGARLVPPAAQTTAVPLLFPLGIALIDLPLELALSSYHGQGQTNYFLPVLPSLAILTAFLVWSVMQALAANSDRGSVKVWLAVLSLPVVFSGWSTTLTSLSPHEQQEILRVAAVVQQYTNPNDSILQWGTDARVYFTSERTAASQFATQQALFTPGYASPEKIQAFLSDLRSQPPALIVDTRPETMPLVTAAQSDCAQFYEDAFMQDALRSDRDLRFPLAKDEPLPYVPAEMKSVYRWVCENYQVVWPENPAPDSWRIYQRTAATP